MKSKNRATMLGFLSLLFWSTSIAFVRRVAESSGTLNTAFFNLLFSGLLLIVLSTVISRGRFLQKLVVVPFSYYARVGIFMALYLVLFYVAVGDASNRKTVIIIGIINYLWPGFTFLFSVFLLKNRARIGELVFGVLIAFAGTVMAMLEGRDFSLADLGAVVREDRWPIFFAFLAALCWGLYSNLTRGYQSEDQREAAAVPIVFLASAGIIFFIQLSKGDIPFLNLRGSGYLEFAYLVIFPTALAYLSWDIAMKRGNKHLITMFSYLVPLVSTVVSGIYLHVPLSKGFGVAVGLVIAGAIICRRSLRE